MARFILIVALVAVVSLSYSESEARAVCKGGLRDRWIEATTICELTCENTLNTTCASEPLIGACRCENNYLRRADGMCVLIEDCGNKNESDFESDLRLRIDFRRDSRNSLGLGYGLGRGHVIDESRTRCCWPSCWRSEIARNEDGHKRHGDRDDYKYLHGIGNGYGSEMVSPLETGNATKEICTMKILYDIIRKLSQ